MGAPGGHSGKKTGVMWKLRIINIRMPKIGVKWQNKVGIGSIGGKILKNGGKMMQNGAKMVQNGGKPEQNYISPLIGGTIITLTHKLKFLNIQSCLLG